MAIQTTKYDELLNLLKDIENRALKHYNHIMDGDAHAITDAVPKLYEAAMLMECPPGFHDDGNGTCVPD